MLFKERNFNYSFFLSIKASIISIIMRIITDVFPPKYKLPTAIKSCSVNANMKDRTKYNILIKNANCFWVLFFDTENL